MAASTSYSKRSSSVKRLLQEAKELADPVDGIHAAPVDDDVFDWHFTLRGPEGSDFQDGLYHGRITLPAQYPFKPPDISLLTPNGRFELNKKVCLSITGYHEESWQAAWGIRTALVALTSFFNTEAKGAIGGLDAPASERKRLAALSREWSCPTCQLKNSQILPDEPKKEPSPSQETPASEVTKSIQRSASEDASTLVGEPDEGAASSSTTSAETIKPLSASSAHVKAPTYVSRAALASHSTTSTSALPPGVAIPRTPSSASITSPTPLQQATISHITASGHPAGEGARQPNLTQQHESQQMRFVEVLTRQLNLGSNEPGVQGRDADITVVGPQLAENGGSPPPVWLDGAIGLVLVALASLLCRKML